MVRRTPKHGAEGSTPPWDANQERRRYISAFFFSNKFQKFCLIV